MLLVYVRLVPEYTGANAHGYVPPILDVRIKFLSPFVDSGDRRKYWIAR